MPDKHKFVQLKDEGVPSTPKRWNTSTPPSVSRKGSVQHLWDEADSSARKLAAQARTRELSQSPVLRSPSGAAINSMAILKRTHTAPTSSIGSAAAVADAASARGSARGSCFSPPPLPPRDASRDLSVSFGSESASPPASAPPSGPPPPSGLLPAGPPPSGPRRAWFTDLPEEEADEEGRAAGGGGRGGQGCWRRLRRPRRRRRAGSGSGHAALVARAAVRLV